MEAFEASLWALKSTGGEGTVTIQLKERSHFLAWANVTMIDSLSDFDDDNAVVAEVFKVDGNETFHAVSGGEHWGDPGKDTNVHQGAFVGFGSEVTFRIRSLHTEDLDSYGMGVVVVL